MKRGVLVSDEGELLVVNGSLVLGDTTMQDAVVLVAAWTGELKHAPMLGGNLLRRLHGSEDAFWAGNVRKQLKQLNMEVEVMIS